MYDVRHKHIQIKSDNTTVVANINNYDTIKQNLSDIIEEIYEWVHERDMDLSAEYIQGFLKIRADVASHERDFNKEWRLMPTLFKDICRIYGEPVIDLFSSHINAQLSLFYSWKH